MSETENTKWHTWRSKTSTDSINQQIQVVAFIDLFNSIQFCSQNSSSTVAYI